MNKILRVVFIFFLFFVFANGDAKISQRDVIVTSAEYISAKAHYKSGDYDIAYNLFEKLFRKNNNHIYVNYYLAMSAVSLQKYDEAVAALERVLITKPDFYRARLEFAKVLYISGLKSQAKEEFTKVLNSNVPQNVKDNIQIYLASLNDDKLYNLYATLMVGLQYSDNVNNGLDDVEFTLPGFSNITVSGEKPDSDRAHIEYLSLDLINKFKKNSSFVLKNRLIGYNRNYKDYDDGDLVFFSYQPTLINYSLKDKTQYSLGVTIDKVIPGKENKNKDKFMAYGIKPKYSFEVFPNARLASYIKYQRILYDEKSSSDRDYNKKEFGFDLYYNTLYAGFSFASDEKNSGDRTDIDKNIWKTNLGYTYKFNDKFLLNTEYEYTNSKYDEEDIFFDSHRKDTTHNVRIGLLTIFDKNNIINLAFSTTYNSSNQNAYDYDKDVATISYIRKFQW